MDNRLIRLLNALNHFHVSQFTKTNYNYYIKLRWAMAHWPSLLSASRQCSHTHQVRIFFLLGSSKLMVSFKKDDENNKEGQLL